MLVIAKRKALIVKPRDPAQLLQLIPTARALTVQGQDLVAVPHRLDEAKVLLNMGMRPPSPIRYHYAWSGAYTPFRAQMDTAEFLTFHRRAYLLSEMGCVDSDTEYLSPTGWRRIADYSSGQVAQYHPESGIAEFVEPTEFVKRPCPTMIRLKTSRGVDQLLSPEHRVLYKDSSGKSKVTSAAAVLQRHLENSRGWKGRIGTTFSGGGTGIALSDAALLVQVAVLADGYFQNGTNRCVIRVKKGRKKDRLRQLLEAAGIAFKERAVACGSAAGFSIFSFKAPLREKSYGPWAWAATNAQLSLIAEECMHWDGSARKAGSTAFFTRDEPSADFVQYAFAATGRTASKLRQQRADGGIDFVVHARAGAADLYVCGMNGAVKSETIYTQPSTDGFKYCFMVPSTFLVLRRNGCIFTTGNTGKTLAALWAYDYLRRMGKVRRLLVVCPLSTMERTWGDEVFRHFPHLDFQVLYGARDRRLKLFRMPADVYIINHDGLQIIEDELNGRGDIDIVMVDEIAQAARNASTIRWKVLNRIINKQLQGRRWCWGMTGTPAPNEPADAWAQCRLVTPDTVPPYFNRFRDTVMRQQGPYAWVARPDAMDRVYDVMRPAIRFSRAECVDLPPCLFQTRHVPLSVAQTKAYKEMLGKLKADLDGGEVLAVNEAVKVSKLVQIACGVAYDTAHQEVSVDSQARLDETLQIIQEAEGKIIVFVPFVSAVHHVSRFLRGKGLSVEVVYGDVPKAERDRIFSAFQTTDSPRVLVAQPAAMSHGVTLTAANTMIWYAPIFSNDIYDQACARITRPGQTKSQLIVNIEGSPVERKMYERLKNKQRLQGVLLSMVESNRVKETP